jgi:hypothetical protein
VLNSFHLHHLHIRLPSEMHRASSVRNLAILALLVCPSTVVAVSADTDGSASQEINPNGETQHVSLLRREPAHSAQETEAEIQLKSRSARKPQQKKTSVSSSALEVSTQKTGLDASVQLKGTPVVWGVNSNHQILARPADASAMWSLVPGGLTWVSVGSTSVWGVTAKNQVYRCPGPCQGNWTLVGGSLAQLDVGDTEVWGVTSGNQVQKRASDGSDDWKTIPGSLARISVGASSVWGVNSQQQIYRCPRPCDGHWVHVSGSYLQVEVASDEAWAVNSLNQIYKRPADGTGQWSLIPGSLNHVSIGLKWVWGIFGQKLFRCQRPCAGTWIETDGSLTQVDVGDI